jgi:hypothetical protein
MDAFIVVRNNMRCIFGMKTARNLSVRTVEKQKLRENVETDGILLN